MRTTAVLERPTLKESNALRKLASTARHGMAVPSAGERKDEVAVVYVSGNAG